MKRTKIGVLMSVLMAFGLMVAVPAISRADDSMMMKKDDAMMMKDNAMVAISGYCPVCIIHGNMKKGMDNYTTEYNGKVYKFAGFEQQKKFIDSPEEYTKDLDMKFQKLGGK